MVGAVRAGTSQRATAARFGVSLATVQHWLKRAGDLPLDEVLWADRSDRPHRTRRTPAPLEELILRVRWELREASVLGEYGAVAIRAALAERDELGWPIPSVRTIGRILERNDMLDRRRRRRPAPPPGWYLPDLAAQRVELDSFDVVEGLKLARGPELSVLTAISLHGGLAGAWPEVILGAPTAAARIVEHWRDVGRPGYAQFDNDGRFVGSSSTTDAIGLVIRMCLALGVTPVFAPPRESGFQAAIESFNGRWQAKLWNRFREGTLEDIRARSESYIALGRRRGAVRIDAAPARLGLPRDQMFDPDGRLRGRIVFLRRTNDDGSARILGRWVLVDPDWQRRLVRAEVDLDRSRLRFYALRRRDPTDQPVIADVAYEPPPRWSP